MVEESILHYRIKNISRLALYRVENLSMHYRSKYISRLQFTCAMPHYYYIYWLAHYRVESLICITALY